MELLRTLLARVGVSTPFARDAVLAGALAAVGVLAVLTTEGIAALAGLDGVVRPVLAVAGIVGSAGALAWRRQAPVASVVGVAAGYLVHLVGMGAPGGMGAGFNATLFVGLYSLGAHAPRRTTLMVAPTVSLAALVAEIALLADGSVATVSLEGASTRLIYAGFVIGAIVYGATALLGAYVQTRRAYQAELVARAEWLEREREEQARRAVADERARLARELHDVVAHHLSGMVVQAGAAERVLDRDVDQARRLVADIRESGRSTLTSMRRLIGILRAEGDTDGTAPQPGLDRLDLVVEQARAAGVDVELAVEGDERRIGDEADLAAYRVIQEGLTNVRKHAPGALARVTVRYLADAVEVVVVDHGAGGEPVEEEPSGGAGLVGLRERVGLLGGTVGAGPNSGGGWTLRARIPTEGQVGQ